MDDAGHETFSFLCNDFETYVAIVVSYLLSHIFYIKKFFRKEVDINNLNNYHSSNHINMMKLLGIFQQFTFVIKQKKNNVKI